MSNKESYIGIPCYYCGEIIDTNLTEKLCYNCYIEDERQMREIEIECENDYLDGLV